MKLYDLLYKKSEDKNGKARWERVGTLIDKGDKKSVKLDVIPISKEWDGWLVVSERKAKEDFFGKEHESELEPF